MTDLQTAAKIAELQARVMAEQAFTLGFDADSRGESQDRHQQAARAMLAYADELKVVAEGLDDG